MKYTNSILTALELAANFTTKKVETVESYGNWDEGSQSWTGSSGLVEKGKVDLINSLYLMTSSRFNSFDYTVPIKELEMCLYIRESSGKLSITWTAYLKVGVNIIILQLQGK